MKKFIALVMTGLMLTTLLVGCKDVTTTPAESSSTPATSDPSETSILRLPWENDLGSADTFGFPWQTGGIMYGMIFDSLIRLEATDGSYTPHIASEYTVSEDEMTYVFTIRNDAKWHDGEAVTIDDVLFSLNAFFLSPLPNFRAQLQSVVEGAQAYADGTSSSISGITVADDKLTINLSQPYGDFLTYLSTLYILPEHLLGTTDPVTMHEDPFWQSPIGSGPYKITEMHSPDYFVAERADTWYGEPAGIKNVNFTFYASGNIDTALIAGEADGLYKARDIKAMDSIVEANKDTTYFVVPSKYARMFVWNTTESEDGKHDITLNNANVRNALMLTLDKTAIAAFYGDIGKPLTTMVNSDSEWYNSDIPLFKRDTVRAKEILNAEGFNYDTTIRIGYYYDDEVTQNVMAMVVQNWAEIGVKAEAFRIVDTYDVVNVQKNWDIYYMGSSGIDYMAVGYGHVNLSTNELSIMAQGDVETKEKMIDYYYNRYMASSDHETRKAALDQIQVNALELAYLSPLYTLDTVWCYNAANLSFPESICGLSDIQFVDYHFEDWALLK